MPASCRYCVFRALSPRIEGGWPLLWIWAQLALVRQDITTMSRLNMPGQVVNALRMCTSRHMQGFSLSSASVSLKSFSINMSAATIKSQVALGNSMRRSLYGFCSPQSVKPRTDQSCTCRRVTLHEIRHGLANSSPMHVQISGCRSLSYQAENLAGIPATFSNQERMQGYTTDSKKQGSDGGSQNNGSRGDHSGRSSSENSDSSATRFIAYTAMMMISGKACLSTALCERLPASDGRKVVVRHDTMVKGLDEGEEVGVRDLFSVLEGEWWWLVAAIGITLVHTMLGLAIPTIFSAVMEACRNKTNLAKPIYQFVSLQVRILRVGV
jgi:hypothetical protein